MEGNQSKAKVMQVNRIYFVECALPWLSVLCLKVCVSSWSTWLTFGAFACTRFLYNFICEVSFLVTLSDNVDLVVIPPSITSQRKWHRHPSSCPITTLLQEVIWTGNYQPLGKLMKKKAEAHVLSNVTYHEHIYPIFHSLCCATVLIFQTALGVEPT